MSTPVRTSPVHARLVTGIEDNSDGHRVHRETGTPDHLLMMTLAGRGVIYGNGSRSTLAEGTVAIIRPGTPHDYGTAPGAKHWEVIWAHFHPWPHWKEWLSHTGEPSGAIVFPLAGTPSRHDAEAALRQMHHDALSSSPQRIRWGMNALERVLLICARGLPPRDVPTRDGRITLVVEHMAHNFAQPLNVPALAAMAGLSGSRFAHLFTEQMQTTPLHYLEMLRMDRARDLLACTVHPVAEIAAEVGFVEPFYFSRRFHKANGMSPRAFRQQAAPVH